MRTLCVVVLLGLVGCAQPPTSVTDGIINLAKVENGVWRGGQPDAQGFATLFYHYGVSNIIKANSITEGDDSPAGQFGMHVTYIPISPYIQMVGNKVVLHEALAIALRNIGPGTYIHCEHGQDRTGLIVAVYQRSKGFSKADAEADMLGHGFHKGLHGLWDYWEDEVK